MTTPHEAPRAARRAPLVLSLAALLLGAAAAAAPVALPLEARAQTAEIETLEQALADVYVAEPVDPAGLRAIFESLKVRQQRHFRIEAGLALAEAAIALENDDAGAAGRAREACEKAAALNPDNRLSRRAQGLGNLAAGRLVDRKRDRKMLLERAVKAFDAALTGREAPERWLDGYRRAQALVELGRAAEATRSCDGVLSILEEGKAGALGAGGKDRARALVTALKARAEASRGALGEAERLLSEAVALAPRDAVLRAELGRLLERRGLGAQARDTLAAALAGEDGAGGTTPLTPRRRSEAARALARTEVALATETAGLAAIAPYASTANPDAEALALRGALRRIKGATLDAQADTADALAKDGFCAEALATRAEILLSHITPTTPTTSPDAAAAVEAAATCAELEPRSARRAVLLSRALRAAGRTADAEAALARSAALAEDAATLTKEGREAPAAAALLDARRAALGERFEEALDAAARALAADPRDRSAQVMIARAHLSISPPRTAEARAAAAALRTIFPKVHDAHAIEAQAALFAGDQAAARQAAERAVALEPRDAAAQRVLSGGGDAATVSTGATKLPPELVEAAKQFAAADPIVRSEAAAQLIGDPAGADLVLAQLERDPDPFVVGALANLLGASGEKRAGPALRRMLHALPESQPIARGRVLRALGRVGDSAILPEILEAVMAGAAESSDSGHAAILSLMSSMEETAAVLFQRALVESNDDLRRALAPVLADHLVKDKIASLDAEGRAASGLMSGLRYLLLAVLVMLGYVRFRFYQREEQIKHLAEAQATRRHLRPAGKSKPAMGEGGSQTGA